MITAFAFAASILLAPTRPAKMLTIGDPAPDLAHANWLKGTPTPKFEKGKVYVVEFWATWCTPCKENIPKLTALAQKYGKNVTIDGVSIWESLDKEDPGALKKVKAFVASEGNKMGYNVAADDRQNSVANRWMKTASEGGLPCSFVIDKTGQIVWIGNAAQLDGVIPHVLDGSWNIAQAKKTRETEQDIVLPVKTAIEAGKYKEALAAIEVSLKKRPSMARFFAYDRLNSLFHTDVDQAIKESEQILVAAKGEIGAYQMIGSIPASQEDLSPAAFRYGLEIDKRALELESNDRKYMFLSMESATNWNLKQMSKAIRLEQEAIEAAEVDPHAPKPFVEFLQRSLAKFQKTASSSDPSKG